MAMMVTIINLSQGISDATLEQPVEFSILKVPTEQQGVQDFNGKVLNLKIYSTHLYIHEKSQVPIDLIFY